MRRNRHSFVKEGTWNTYRRLIPLASFAAFFAAVGIAAIQASFGVPIDKPGGANDEPATEAVVVQYKSSADTNSLKAKYAKYHAVQSREITKLRTTVIKVPRSQREQTVRELQADPGVQSVEPDYIAHAEATIPNDALYASQPEWTNTHVNEVWDITKGGPIIVAVIDTGVNMRHVDLIGKIAAGGYDFANNDTDPTDDVGHGTAVSGVIAASSNNSVGIAGGCWNCKILPVKVLGSDASGSVSAIAQGIQYAVDHGAKIINTSLSIEADSSVLKASVDYATSRNVFFVSAAGNQAGIAPRWPAAYPSVMSVAGNDLDDKLNAGSNSGATVDIAAPWHVFTTSYPGDTTFEGWSGTSLSSPIVSATGALLMTAYPNASIDAIKTAMIATADPCCSNKFPGGRLNAAKALAYLANASPANQGDVNADKKVNLTDLSILLSNWNTTKAIADINKSGKVDLTDLSILLSKWTG